MSLNDQSLIVFGTTTLFYFMVYTSLFLNPSPKKFFLLFLTWLVHVGTILWYGIVTNQIGFVLWFGLEIIMVYLVYIITGKVLKDEDTI